MLEIVVLFRLPVLTNGGGSSFVVVHISRYGPRRESSHCSVGLTTTTYHNSKKLGCHDTAHMKADVPAPFVRIFVQRK